jgi:hypothetical protein
MERRCQQRQQKKHQSSHAILYQRITAISAQSEYKQS